MKTKYKINQNELVVSFYFLYNIKNKPNNLKNIIKYVNLFLQENHINFKGNTIVIYINGILIGNLYLTNFYLKKINFNNSNQLLNENNCYFQQFKVIEIKPQSNRLKTKKVLSY